VTPATITRAQAFKELRQNVELTGLQKTMVSKRQGNIRDALTDQLDVLGDFLIGSYCRHTLIGPLKDADVDVMVVLDPQYWEKGPAGVLDGPPAVPVGA
jgi:Second Messenger Oligonucleotide or Dinucleotide Synthetase domain